jgi:hypothetical protein
LVVIMVDDVAELLLVLPLLLLLPLLHAAAASSATASGAANLTGTGTRASNEALIVIIPLVRRLGCLPPPLSSVVMCELNTA